MSKLSELFHTLFRPHVVGSPTGPVPGKPIPVPVTPKPTLPQLRHRDYGDMQFPIVISAWKVGWIPGMVQGYGLWDALPLALRTKILAAKDANEDLTITNLDLDTIDDATWVKVTAAVSF